LLCAGLIHDDEAVTEKDVGSWIPVQALQTIAGTITKALTESLPSEDDQKT
jgi:hypothetical protein